MAARVMRTRPAWAEAIAVIALAALPAVAQTPPPAATPAPPKPAGGLINCFDPKGDCKWKPPCEYTNQISEWQQTRDLFKSKKIQRESLLEAQAQLEKESRKKLPLSDPGVQDRATNIMQIKIGKLAQNRNVVKVKECKNNHGNHPAAYVDPETCRMSWSLWTMENGSIVKKDLTRKDVDAMSVCREIVDATAAHEEMHRVNCCGNKCTPACKQAECDEAMRRKRCRDNPGRPECSVYNGHVPPPPPSGKDIKTYVEDETHGYDESIRYLKATVAARRASCYINKDRGNPKRALDKAKKLQKIARRKGGPRA